LRGKGVTLKKDATKDLQSDAQERRTRTRGRKSMETWIRRREGHKSHGAYRNLLYSVGDLLKKKAQKGKRKMEP